MLNQKKGPLARVNRWLAGTLRPEYMLGTTEILADVISVLQNFTSAEMVD